MRILDFFLQKSQSDEPKKYYLKLKEKSLLQDIFKKKKKNEFYERII